MQKNKIFWKYIPILRSVECSCNRKHYGTDHWYLQKTKYSKSVALSSSRGAWNALSQQFLLLLTSPADSSSLQHPFLIPEMLILSLCLTLRWPFRFCIPCHTLVSCFSHRLSIVSTTILSQQHLLVHSLLCSLLISLPLSPDKQIFPYVWCVPSEWC